MSKGAINKRKFRASYTLTDEATRIGIVEVNKEYGRGHGRHTFNIY